MTTRAQELTGAAYIAAIFSDQALAQTYRNNFEAEELLDAIQAPLHAIGKYVSFHTGCTLAQTGEALIDTYTRLLHARADAPDTEIENPS